MKGTPRLVTLKQEPVPEKQEPVPVEPVPEKQELARVRACCGEWPEDVPPTAKPPIVVDSPDSSRPLIMFWQFKGAHSWSHPEKRFACKEDYVEYKQMLEDPRYEYFRKGSCEQILGD